MARRSDSQDEVVEVEVVEETTEQPEDSIVPSADEIVEEAEELEDLELIRSGKPVPFTITVGGEEKEYAIKQLDPHDLALVRLQENIGYNIAMDQPGMEELKKLGVSDEAKAERMLILAKYTADHDQATDPEKRRELGALIEQWSRPDNRTRAQEIADKHARRHRDQWMIDNLTVYPDGTALKIEDRQHFNHPAYIEMARPACWRVIRLATQVPS